MLQLRADATLREGLWKESKGKSRGADGGKGYACGKGKTIKGTEKKGSGKSGGPREGPSGEAKSWGYQRRCWTCGRVGHKSAECECGVELLTPEEEEACPVKFVENSATG